MTCGVPIVSSHIDGNVTWNRNGENGQLFEVGDVVALAGTLGSSTATPEIAAEAIELVRNEAALVLNRRRLLDVL